MCYQITLFISLPLSLYSTATQNYWRWGFVSGQPPQHKNLAIPTCWYLKTLKCALPSTRNPIASQGIGRVGSPTQNFCVGYVDFKLFFPFSFALGTQRKRCSQWNMDFISTATVPVYQFYNNNLLTLCSAQMCCRLHYLF